MGLILAPGEDLQEPERGRTKGDRETPGVGHPRGRGGDPLEAKRGHRVVPPSCGSNIKGRLRSGADVRTLFLLSLPTRCA